MKKSIFTGIATMIMGFILFNSCVKETPDEPAHTTIPFDPDKVMTIADIKQKIEESGGVYTFQEGEIYSVFATVVMDEKSGNIYKSSFVQDETGGIQLNLQYAGGLYLGDSIRILLQGTTISTYSKLFQIQNINVGKQIEKIKTNVIIEPELVTISQLNNNITKYQSTLIRLDSVEFIASNLFTTYADSVNLEDKSKILQDCKGDQIEVRTSGYANFANELLPYGKGSLIAIAGRYNDDEQLTIRTTDEVFLNGLRCDGCSSYKLIEGFDFGMANWEVINIIGDQIWEFDDSHGNPGYCVTVSGYENGTNYTNEDWLISEAIDSLYYQYSSTYFSFETAKYYSGNPLKVKISNDYDGNGDPASANWTDLQVTLSSGNWTWTSSGVLDISEFVKQNKDIYVAFWFTSTSSKSATWELDNIIIGGVGK